MRQQDGEWIAVGPLDLVGWRVEIIAFMPIDDRFYGSGTFILEANATSSKGEPMARIVCASEEAVPVIALELRR